MGAGSAPSSAPSGLDVDSVVRQLGVLGRFHRRVYPLVALAAVQVGLLHTTYIFLAADVNYRYKCPLVDCRAASLFLHICAVKEI